MHPHYCNMHNMLRMPMNARGDVSTSEFLEPRPAPHMTGAEFREHGHALVDWIADYWAGMERLPVTSDVVAERWHA